MNLPPFLASIALIGDYEHVQIASSQGYTQLNTTIHVVYANKFVFEDMYTWSTTACPPAITLAAAAGTGGGEYGRHFVAIEPACKD
jgi:hypothetical protein